MKSIDLLSQGESAPRDAHRNMFFGILWGRKKLIVSGPANWVVLALVLALLIMLAGWLVWVEGHVVTPTERNGESRFDIKVNSSPTRGTKGQ